MAYCNKFLHAEIIDHAMLKNVSTYISDIPENVRRVFKAVLQKENRYPAGVRLDGYERPQRRGA